MKTCQQKKIPSSSANKNRTVLLLLKISFFRYIIDLFYLKIEPALQVLCTKTGAEISVLLMFAHTSHHWHTRKAVCTPQIDGVVDQFYDDDGLVGWVGFFVGFLKKK